MRACVRACVRARVRACVRERFCGYTSKHACRKLLSHTHTFTHTSVLPLPLSPLSLHTHAAIRGSTRGDAKRRATERRRHLDSLILVVLLFVLFRITLLIISRQCRCGEGSSQGRAMGAIGISFNPARKRSSGIYVYIHIFIYIYIHVDVYIYICIFVYMYRCIYLSMSEDIGL